MCDQLQTWYFSSSLHILGETWFDFPLFLTILTLAFGGALLLHWSLQTSIYFPYVYIHMLRWRFILVSYTFFVHTPCTCALPILMHATLYTSILPKLWRTPPLCDMCQPLLRDILNCATHCPWCVAHSYPLQVFAMQLLMCHKVCLWPAPCP